MLCLRAAGQAPRNAETTPVEEYLALKPNPELATFRIRVALTAVCFSGVDGPDDGHSILNRIVSEVLDVEDGYVARDLLRNSDLRGRLIAAQQAHLVSTVQSAGLGKGVMPEPLSTELLAAAEESRYAAAELLHRLPVAELS
ncbi:hypothetical protein [Actinomadura chokoriensis]|uniref:Uncharacterized protein n=1 Tax=Actinomadura chokoriensis TaxID=454156 RepID=A0ABV4R609_9ACTN